MKWKRWTHENFISLKRHAMSGSCQFFPLLSRMTQFQTNTIWLFWVGMKVLHNIGRRISFSFSFQRHFFVRVFRHSNKLFIAHIVISDSDKNFEILCCLLLPHENAAVQSCKNSFYETTFWIFCTHTQNAQRTFIVQTLSCLYLCC